MNISGSGSATPPGGSTTQIQFNNAGAFAGDAGLTFDSSTGKLTIGKQLVIASGAVTTDSPLLNLTQTWNNVAVTFTGLKLNVTDTASAAASSLLTLQVGGTNQFSVEKDGTAVVGNTSGGGGLKITKSGSVHPYLTRSNTDGALILGSSVGTTTPVYFGTNDCALARDAANTLAQRNGTSAQLLRLYATTDASTTNYERGKVGWVGSTFTLGTEKGGTGSARAMEFQTDGAVRMTINSSGTVVMADATNIATGTTTGTKIGTNATNKIGFFNATPVVQPAAVADSTGAGDVVAQLNALLARMRSLGLIAP